mmetsp:Transcript_8488/g.17968  ORF Transcript_8488/g.17968 Transcript_8488/m.17968 type:complete len:213 (-) Transcript_8488:7-645(-)
MEPCSFGSLSNVPEKPQELLQTHMPKVFAKVPCVTIHAHRPGTLCGIQHLDHWVCVAPHLHGGQSFSQCPEDKASDLLAPQILNNSPLMLIHPYCGRMSAVTTLALIAVCAGALGLKNAANGPTNVGMPDASMVTASLEIVRPTPELSNRTASTPGIVTLTEGHSRCRRRDTVRPSQRLLVMILPCMNERGTTIENGPSYFHAVLTGPGPHR